MWPISRRRSAFAAFDAQSLKLAQAFWPGPLTLVLPKARRLPGGRARHRRARQLAVRVPAHPVALAILRGAGPAGGRALGQPLRPRLADHRRARVARPRRPHRPDRRRRRRWPVGRGIHHRRRCLGARRCCCARAACRATAIERVLGGAGWTSAGRRRRGRPAPHPLAPGMLASHYAPRAAVRLDAASVAAGEALLAFGPAAIPGRSARPPCSTCRPAATWWRPPPICSPHLRALDAAGARARSR